MTNTYVLGNARWTKILARNRNVAPGNAINFKGRGVPSFIGAGDGAVPLGTKNRIHIVNGAEAFTLQKEMGATVQVNARPPIASGKYIVKTSWYRGAKGVDFEKWARQCRKEAYIQSELSTQYARCGIFPRVMFHGFVRGAFHVVSECPPNIRLIDIERISTVSEARATYNAVAAAIYLMWTSKVAPMRYAPHMFALAGPARSPHAVVLDYNQIVVFDEVVDKAFLPYLQRLKAVEGSCGRLSTKPGTLESIWVGLRSVTRRMMAKHVSLYKSHKEPGRTKYTSVIDFLARLGETMNDPPAAGRRAVSGGGRGRRTVFGRGLRGILGGRRGSRSDPDKKSPPLKIRKVATLPESEGGWRPRKHSAMWGVTRTAESNHNNHNSARHGNRTSQFRAPNAIYTPPKSTQSNRAWNENGIASAPQTQSTQMFPASSAPPNPFVNNRNKEYNANYNLGRVKDEWRGWNATRKEFVLKSEMNKFDLPWLERMKSAPEIIMILKKQAMKRIGKNTYNRTAPNTQARIINDTFDEILKSHVTNALRSGKYVNNASRVAHSNTIFKDILKESWKEFSIEERMQIISEYIKKMKMKNTLVRYLEWKETPGIDLLKSKIFMFEQIPENQRTISAAAATKKFTDGRLIIYIASALSQGMVLWASDDQLFAYIKEQLVQDIKMIQSKSISYFAKYNTKRAVNHMIQEPGGFFSASSVYMAPLSTSA